MNWNSFFWNCLFTCGLGVGLALTYNRCIECVFCILLLSGVTMSCIPTMPMVFMLSCFVLLMHAIDYRNASIKVEVPLENLMYIPTWDEVHKYVHFYDYHKDSPSTPKSTVSPALNKNSGEQTSSYFGIDRIEELQAAP
jgi:hypothetical protein